jgi:uncharacterized protein YqkB
MKNKNKLQQLLISHLLKDGQVQLLLPDGMILDIGITQEDKNGDMVKSDDYCWLIATQKGRDVSMDSYNMGLRYIDDSKKIVFEDGTVDKDGMPYRIMDIV